MCSTLKAEHFKAGQFLPASHVDINYCKYKTLQVYSIIIVMYYLYRFCINNVYIHVNICEVLNVSIQLFCTFNILFLH